MSVSKIAGLLLSSAAMVAGHGFVSGAVVDGTYHGGFIVTSYNYMDQVPENIGWAEKATDTGFIDGSGYSSPDIICHKEATPGAISAEVKAGGSVELQWTQWPESHHGPVITYMANCNGDCSSVDKTSLKFFKIHEAGLIDGSNAPGKWASDDLIAANNSATVTIPSGIASGNYVLRHEIIALHSAGEQNGAQNYPQCINLKVTGGGSDTPSGTLGTDLYKAADPGILVNIYTSMSSYDIPGPALYTGASSGGSPSPSTTPAASAPTTASASSTVSASPIPSSSSFPSSHPHPSRTRTITGRPTHSHSSSATSIPTSAPTLSLPGGPEPVFTDAPSVTKSASATQVTDEPAEQTAAPTDVAITVGSPGGQSAQSSAPAGGDASGPSATAAPVPVTTSGPASGSSDDSDWSSYLSSLSADQLLGVIRSTLKWLVSENKVHARDLSS
ncbi:uncharacterized protein N7515_004932 [Penicillium bovifimosum]|uniref:Auxiliary Activity family 9 catalytic domain-containing protein n=1 Tax=Penicillium bovifimosum TaxID=126998 RepID=A0A9W9H124_9EURO|nr:uncharacterized protein N7515_004932 [Penicillium bovifimosum]KAJ5135654.1 hypothetical protein N7515_004932 [Penicillium bovifimosum]